jgi:hypothetical protein
MAKIAVFKVNLLSLSELSSPLEVHQVSRLNQMPSIAHGMSSPLGMSVKGRISPLANNHNDVWVSNIKAYITYL